ncbi:MAG: aldehyde dehydrogenase family protein, partial [Rhodospirillaceae bacterium]|nr:aldehyde dehydrogenase family protein [Rhodospirillaceae bacterium]
MDKRQFYIDGRWVPPRQANDFDVIDPSTEDVVGVISLGDQADTDAAVAAAKSAFDGWSASSRDERVTLLERILELYEARSDDISHAISQEMGAPIDLARSQQTGSGLGHIKGFIRT